jgi:hypothetical protein
MEPIFVKAGSTTSDICAEKQRRRAYYVAEKNISSKLALAECRHTKRNFYNVIYIHLTKLAKTAS